VALDIIKTITGATDSIVILDISKTFAGPPLVVALETGVWGVGEELFV